MVSDGETATRKGRGGWHRARCAHSDFQRLAEVLLLLALLCALPRAMAADAVDITAVVGFADTLHPGRWTPLSVTVTNRGGSIAGELEVLVTGGDELHGRRF